MRYRSTYLDADGRQATAVVDAPDEQELHDLLHKQGRLLLAVRAIESDERPRDDRRLPSRKLLSFTQSMETALEAGVPLLTVLEAVREQEEDARIRRIYDGVIEAVRQGTNFADALAAYPRAFPPIYVALIAAGDSSGSLPGVFGHLGRFLEWQDQIRGVAKQAMIYPAVIATASLGLVLFLLSFVIPRLGDVIRKVADQLPPASVALLELSDLVAGNVPWVLLGIVVLVATIVRVVTTEWGRTLAASLFVRLPVTRRVVLGLNRAQLCRTMAVLLSAGLTVVKSLELTAITLSSRRMREDLDVVHERLHGGVRFSDAIRERAALPLLAQSMLRVGEDAGNLPLVFDRLGRRFDEDAKVAVQRLIALLEPAITVVLGLTVGTIAVIVVTTLYSAIGGLAQ